MPLSDSLKSEMRSLIAKRDNNEITADEFVKQAKRIKDYVESGAPEGGFKSTGNLPLDLVKGVMAPGIRAAVLTGSPDPVKREEGYDIWRSMGRGGVALLSRLTATGVRGYGATPPVNTPWGVATSDDELNASFAGLVGGGLVAGAIKTAKRAKNVQRAADLAVEAATHKPVAEIAKGLARTYEKPPIEGWQAKWREAYDATKRAIDDPLEKAADEYVYHGSPIEDLTEIAPGSYFSDLEYAKGYAKKSGAGPGSGRVYRVKRSEVVPMKADPSDVFGQAEIDVGGSLRSSVPHKAEAIDLFTMKPIEPPATLAPDGGLPRPAVDLVKESVDNLVERGVEPKAAFSRSVDAVSGRTVALSKWELGALRTFAGLDKLAAPLRRAWVRVANEAKMDGLVHEAMNLAEAIRAKPFPISDKQHASLVLKAADLKRQLTQHIDDGARALDAGDTGAAEIADQMADVARKNIDKLTEAADMAGSEAGRALSVRRMMVNMDTYDITSILRRAKVAKGGALTKADELRFQELVKNNDDLRKQLEQADIRWQQKLDEQARIGAESVVREAAVKTRVRTAKDAARAERASIKEKLRKLGVQTTLGSSGSASGPEELYLIGRLGLSYIKEGVFDLKDVVKNVLSDVPDLEERDVWQALNAKNPEAAARTEVQLAIRDIKREAKLLDQIETITEGGMLEPASKLADPPYPKKVQELNNLMNELKTAYGRREFNPKRLESMFVKIENVKKQIAEGWREVKTKNLSKDVTPEFLKARAGLTELRKELKLGDKLTELEDYIKKKQVPPKRTRVAPNESIEVQRLRLQVKRQQARIQTAIHELKPKTAWNRVVSGMNSVRSLQTVLDLGTTMRQNMMLSILRPGAAAKALGKSIRAGFSEEYALKLDAATRAQPANFYRERAGLFMPEVDDLSLTPTDEHFQKSWVDKLGFVKASKRQFVTATNQLRAAAFDEILDVPNATTDEMRMWADFVNKASGRGDLGSLSRAANLLSVGFFAPRFTASRFQTFTALIKHRKSPLVRKMIAKELGSTVGVGMTALGILSLHPDIEVSADPHNPDFGKIKIGDVRYDIWGGYQQMARFVAQMILTPTDAAGWTSDKSRLSADPMKILQRFAEFKAAPGPLAIREAITGTDIVGNKVKEIDVPFTDLTLPPLAVTGLKLGSPLVARDIWETYHIDEDQTIPAGIMALMGGNVSAYEAKSRGGKRPFGGR